MINDRISSKCNLLQKLTKLKMYFINTFISIASYGAIENMPILSICHGNKSYSNIRFIHDPKSEK